LTYTRPTIFRPAESCAAFFRHAIVTGTERPALVFILPAPAALSISSQSPLQLDADFRFLLERISRIARQHDVFEPNLH